MAKTVYERENSVGEVVCIIVIADAGAIVDVGAAFSFHKIKINALLRIFKCKPMIKDNLRTF